MMAIKSMRGRLDFSASSDRLMAVDTAESTHDVFTCHGKLIVQYVLTRLKFSEITARAGRSSDRLWSRAGHGAVGE
jgi:hypothetical protein